MLHRDDDKPAYIDKFGNKSWYKNGKKMRENGKPTVEYETGLKHCHNEKGLLHRDGDLPAVMTTYGDIKYKIDGKLHRIHGPAHIHDCTIDRFLIYCEKTSQHQWMTKFENCKKEWYYNGNKVNEKWIKDNKDKLL